MLNTREATKRAILSFLVAAILQFPPALAQTPEDEGLTLPLAVEIAMRTNPLVRATTSGREMADAQLSEARAGRYPFLQLGETFTRSNNPVFVFGSLLEQGRFGPQNFDLTSLNAPDPLNNFRTAITFRLPIFDQRRTRTQISQSEIARRRADVQGDLVRQQVRFEVLDAYYGMKVAQARKEVADEAARMADADVKRIRDMFEAGTVVASDLLAAEVQLAEFRQQQIQAEGDIAIARAALNTALGVAIDTPQKIAGRLVERQFDAGSQEEVIRLAMEHRPEMARARLGLESAKERSRASRSEFLPRLDVFGSVGASSSNLTNGSADYAIGASLTFTLFDAGRKARIARARAAEDMAAAEQEQLANQVRLDVVRAYQQYVSARERVAVAVRASEQAEEALRIVRDRYQEGLTTITEVLRAETALVRTRMGVLRSRYDHYVGYARVLMASGRLTDVQPFL
jgi:outer membrane protein TolC